MSNCPQRRHTVNWQRCREKIRLTCK